MNRDLPTFEVASVKLRVEVRERPLQLFDGLAYLFRVVDFPADGLPTNPMSGSRGIVDVKDSTQYGWRFIADRDQVLDFLSFFEVDRVQHHILILRCLPPLTLISRAAKD